MGWEGSRRKKGKEGGGVQRFLGHVGLSVLKLGKSWTNRDELVTLGKEATYTEKLLCCKCCARFFHTTYLILIRIL